MKKIISLFLVLSLLVGMYTLPVSASETSVLGNELDGIRLSDYIDDEDLEFFSKLEKVLDEFTLSKDGTLELKKSLIEIQEEAGFSKAEMVIFEDMLGFNKENPAIGITQIDSQIDESAISTKVYVEDWKVYFTYDEVLTLLFAAAQIGPAAMVAALSALGTAIGGLVGTTVAAILGYITAASFCYLVIRAVSMKKGVYIGLDWDGPFPVIADGTW